MTAKKKSEQNHGIRITRRKLTELMNLQSLIITPYFPTALLLSSWEIVAFIFFRSMI